jgi:DNA-binding CsgD family transcriptional regulator
MEAFALRRKAQSPDQKLLLVTIINPNSPLPMSAAELAACLGITEAEARIVGLLCEGSTLRNSASKLNVSYTTARNQLASACTKTGLHTQLQLVRYVMAILARVPFNIAV